jgi:PEP-CTERM motif
MKNALIKWVAGLAVAVSQTVSAMPITDTVIVGSQEWAQVNLFTNVSWNDLNTQCPGGVCSAASTLNGYDLEGWTWASVDVVQTLFNGFTGRSDVAPSFVAQYGSVWAPSFFSLFTPTFTSAGGGKSLNGMTSTLTVCCNSAFVAYVEYGLENEPDEIGTDFVIDIAYDGGDRYVGGWFYRADSPTPAPVPATLALFGLGLASMAITRRKCGARV